MTSMIKTRERKRRTWATELFPPLPSQALGGKGMLPAAPLKVWRDTRIISQMHNASNFILHLYLLWQMLPIKINFTPQNLHEEALCEGVPYGSLQGRIYLHSAATDEDPALFQFFTSNLKLVLLQKNKSIVKTVILNIYGDDNQDETVRIRGVRRTEGKQDSTSVLSCYLHCFETSI